LKFLYLLYYFPPEPFAASVRAYNYTKYLKEIGFSPFIVTKKIPENILKDLSLIEDLGEIHIERVYDFLPFIKLPVKRKKGGREFKRYLRNFLKKSSFLIEKENLKFIFVTLPPFELLKVGVSLKLRYKIPLVCEIRDPADFESAKKFKKFIKNSEKLVDLFIASHDYVLSSFKIKGEVIYAGYYEFERRKHSGFNIVYTGTLKNAEESFKRFLNMTRNVDFNLFILGADINLNDTRIRKSSFVEYKKLKDYFEISDLFIIFRDKDCKNYIPLKFFEYSGNDVPVIAYFKKKSNLFEYLKRFKKGKGFIWGEEKDMLKYLENVKRGIIKVEKFGKTWKERTLEIKNAIYEKIFNRNNGNL